MRFLLLLLALLAACPFAQAQLIPAATPAVLSPSAAPATVPIAPDTAAALHRLFALQRHRGHVGLAVGGGILAVSSILVLSTAHGSGYQNLGIGLSGVLGIAGSVMVLTKNTIRSVTYSKKREQRIVQAWPQHRLPRHLKRALEADSLLAAQARLAKAAALAALGPVAASAEARDTAAALHRFFVAKRHLFRVVLPLTAAIGVGFALRLDGQPYFPSNTGTVILGATTLLVAGELATLGKYSKKHEAQALQALKEHRLPATQSQELKAEYFRPAKATP